MVTDEEYRELKKRVEELEQRVAQLSKTIGTLYFKKDANLLIEPQKQDKHKKHKDVTKYLFNGRTISKRELVLRCVKEYISKNITISGDELRNVFPDYVQGSLGVVRKLEEAEWYAGSKKRFYLSDEDILHLSDGDYVVCTQWDAKNIGKFLKLAEDIGFEITIMERKYN